MWGPEGKMLLANGNNTIKKVDVTIKDDSFETLCAGSLEVLKHVQNWPSDKVKFELFTDGITNNLLKCYMDDPEDGILMRVYGKRTELFIDRDLEVRNMRMMWEAGQCAPLYCAFKNGLCYGFSPGGVLDTDMVRDPLISRLIAQRLAEMHNIRSHVNGVAVQPCLFPVLHKYLQLVPESFEDPVKDERFKALIPPKEVLVSEVNVLKVHLTTLDSPVVFCHNDLLLKNIIFNKDKENLTFIDYEYANYNYQAFDIGNHFCEFAGVDKYEPTLYPNKDFQIKWLRQYLEAWYLVKGWSNSDITESVIEKFYVQVNKFALAAHLFWGIWALIQAAHSNLEFDFLGYASQRIQEYFKQKDLLFSNHITYQSSIAK